MWSPRQEFGPRGATETPACRLDVAVLYVEYSLEPSWRTDVSPSYRKRQVAQKKLRAQLPMGIVSPVGAAAFG